MALFMRCLTSLPRFQILFLLEFKTTRLKLPNTISAYKFCLIWLSLCTTSPTPSSLLLKLLYAPSLSLSLWPKQMQQSIRRKLTIVICHWFTQIALPLTLTIPYQEQMIPFPSLTSQCSYLMTLINSLKPPKTSAMLAQSMVHLWYENQPLKPLPLLFTWVIYNQNKESMKLFQVYVKYCLWINCRHYKHCLLQVGPTILI